VGNLLFSGAQATTANPHDLRRYAQFTAAHMALCFAFTVLAGNVIETHEHKCNNLPDGAAP
jgi:hypothetical protein